MEKIQIHLYFRL